MSADTVEFIASRKNPLIQNLRRLTQDGRAIRKQASAWLEGDHLCRAALERNITPTIAVFASSFWPSVPEDLKHAASRTIVLSDPLIAAVSTLPSEPNMGFVIDLPSAPGLLPNEPTVVLDRIQDAGNTGSILRSAAALGFTQIAALKGTALLWSAKTLRAGMGAHFALRLVEGLSPKDLSGLSVPLLVTSSHHGQRLDQTTLPWPCAWVIGNEGQGVCDAIDEQAALRLRIAQPGGQESLNVAAAAAICLYTSAVQKNSAIIEDLQDTRK
jgi:TrmH family RNA methyltransferase